MNSRSETLSRLAVKGATTETTGEDSAGQLVKLNSEGKIDPSMLYASENETPVNADWDAVEGLAQILNKPEEFPPSAHQHDVSNGITTVEVSNGMLLTADGEGGISFTNPLDLQFDSTTETDDIEVTGAGSEEANGVYTIDGEENSHTKWVNGDIKIVWAGSNYWLIYDNANAQALYRDGDAIEWATPDLVLNWITVEAGVEPVPEVSVYHIDQDNGAVATADGSGGITWTSPAKQTISQFVSQASYYSNGSPTFASFALHKAIQCNDGANSAIPMVSINPSYWNGKSVKVQLIVGVNGTSGGNISWRGGVSYTTSVLDGTVNDSYTPGNSTVGQGVVTATAAPTVASALKIFETAAFTIPANCTAAAIWADLRRTDGGDTNTDTAYMVEIRLVEQ